MKKTKKALASLAIASMALSIVPFNALAAVTTTRIAGTTAAQTAVAIAEQTGWTGTAILASSESYGMVDALTAGPLASYLKAPILLTGAGNTLDADTKAELTKLAVKTVYVTSGTAVISQAVLNELTGMGITVVPLGGFDRAATSVNIAKKMVGVTKVAVANGLQDALSIAAIASAANEPILLTDKDAVPASVSAYLAANSGITSSDVIGGTGIISDAVKAALPNATRHAGYTAYDTNNQIIQDFNDALKYDNVYVANGVTGIDALAGAPLAAQTKSPIVLTDGTVPAAATFVYSKLATGAVVTALGGTAVVTEAVRTGVATGQVAPPTGTLSVTSVSAISANSLKVVFNQAPADATKVTMAVTRSTTPVVTTVTWNSAKTEATLTAATNLPEGTYAVAVKDGTTDLGNSSVAITQQKVAKINITSSKLAVNNNTGYASYQVLDQYGNDITTSYLANNIVFQSGVSGGAGGGIVKKNGLITLTPNTGTTLITYATVVISGSDSTSGVSTSASLATSTALGTLTNLTLNKLTNADNKVLTAGDTASVWYIDYTATDISGNETKNLSLVQNGLINGNLITSNNNVIAVVDQDPADTNKAVIKVTVTNATITTDMPVTITAMTYTGTNSTLDLTLKKASSLDTFTLMAPSYDIASGEEKAIPFVAYDQNGTQLTKFADLNVAGLSLTGCKLAQNVDGTASVVNIAVTNNGTQSIPVTLTAVTSTGKLSTITLNIQKIVKAETLSIDSTKLVSTMQSGAIQKVDFGYDKGGLTVKDQYGRVMDLTGGAGVPAGASYAVQAVPFDATVVTAAGEAKIGQNQITFTAAAAAATGGTTTVTFNLVDLADGHAGTAADPHTVLDSKNVSFSVMKNDDIKDYTIDTIANPVFANADLTAITGRDNAYSAQPKVYGLTASGAKVVMATAQSGSNLIVGANVTNVDDFKVDTFKGALGAFDSIYVSAGKLTNNRTTAETTLSVTLKGADGKVHSVTTPIKSSTAAPVASTLVADVDTSVNGVQLNPAGDVATVQQGSIASAGFVAGNTMQRFSAAGADNRAKIHFYALDQYGTKGGQLAQIVTVSKTMTDAVLKVDANGLLSGSMNMAVGDSITLTGVTNNGLTKTIRIDFAAGGVVVPVSSANVTVAVGAIPSFKQITVNSTDVTGAVSFSVDGAAAVAIGTTTTVMVPTATTVTITILNAAGATLATGTLDVSASATSTVSF